MANLLDIRRRIRSVRNTQQITRAMKTVSAAKLRRAQERVFAARPYAEQLRTVLGNLASRIEALEHPLLTVREEANVLIVVITADRGLCGAFNANVIRAATAFIRERSNRQEVQVMAVGRKGRDVFRRQGQKMLEEHVNIFSTLSFTHAQDISRRIVEVYSSGDSDAIYLAYNEFKSVIQQRLVIEPILPISAATLEEGSSQVDYIYEQPPAEVFNRLLPQYVDVQVHRALLESAAAEHGARMAAMDTASRNAGEMIDALTLNMNRIRQAAITREIIEVVSGASA
jgi:F-type H+-transporting ATPase subunit gamma